MDNDTKSYLLAALITSSNEANLSLELHSRIKEVCEKITANLCDEDLKILFYANPDLVIEAKKGFDEIRSLFMEVDNESISNSKTEQQ